MIGHLFIVDADILLILSTSVAIKVVNIIKISP